MRAREFINEEINTDVLDPRFKHEQEIGDYKYTAELEPDRFHPNQPLFVIKCYDDDKMIGQAKFYTTFGESLVSALTNVHPDYQKQGIASTMYAYARMLGNTIEPSASQLPPGKKMWKSWKKSGDAQHLMKEDTNSTTLAKLYGGDYPERDETFWDYVRPHEFDIPLDIQTLPKHKVMFMLLGQYRVEHIDEIMDMLDDDRKELVQHYVDDPALSSKVIVLAGDRIIDGNHRALAAAIKGVPINYVDLVDMEETDEIDEGLRVDVPNEDWLQDAIDYAKQKSPDRNGLPYMGKTTATVRPDQRVSVDVLKRLPGMRNEQKNVRHEDLAAIMKIMKDTGKLPLSKHDGSEYAPFINVAYDGSAWVNEGNHRIMAAAALGWEDLPVQISYFDGGERIQSGPMYPGKIGLGESIDEAEASDAALAARYGEFDPEDKPMLPRTQVGGAPAPTLWTAYQAIEDILGKRKVTDDEDELKPGMYYVYQSNQPAMFRDTGDGVGSINLPNLDSTAAADIAVAVHEAYHAYVQSRSHGGVVHANEKIINKLAEKWLRKHLTGPELHVALEKIIGSRISYGPHHIPSGPLSDKR